MVSGFVKGGLVWWGGADLRTVMECFSKMALDLTGLTVVGVELENLKTDDPKIEYVPSPLLSSDRQD